MTLEQENAEISEMGRRRERFDELFREAQELESRGAAAEEIDAARAAAERARLRLAELFGEDEE